MNPQQQDQPEWNGTPEGQPVQDDAQFSRALDDDDQYNDHDNEPAEVEMLSWESSESVHHEKDALWFVAILVAGVAFALLSIFLLKSITFTVLIVVMVISLFVLAKRPPRVLKYKLSDQGISINEKHYSLHDFRAFGVVQDGPFYYISLIPIKRFMPAIDVYFPEEYGEDIVDTLGERIPLKTIEPDILDRVTKHLRF